MKITFIGYQGNQVNIFDDLIAGLGKKISGLETEQRFVPYLEDLPEIAQESAEDSDFIFVFALVEDEKEIPMIEEKLIDVELKTNTRILKEVRPDDLSSVPEENYYSEKESMVRQLSETIVNILFNEEKFRPEDRDFSL